MRGRSMPVYRALALVAILAALLQAAQAQFGGMPGMPGMGAPGFGGPLVAPRAERPPACQQLLALRGETGKNAAAILKAWEKMAGPAVVCKLVRALLASEADMIKA